MKPSLYEQRVIRKDDCGCPGETKWVPVEVFRCCVQEWVTACPPDPDDAANVEFHSGCHWAVKA